MGNFNISVAIPTYNRVDLFEDTVESLMNQTISNVEIVISDNSTDEKSRNDIKKLCDLLSIKFLSCSYIFTEPNIGLPKNTNQALDNCSGKYIRILHSDDILNKFALEFENHYISTHSVDILYHSTLHFNDKNTIRMNEHPSILNISPRSLMLNWMHSNTAIPSAMLFSRSILNSVGNMREDMPFLCDWDLFFKMVYHQYLNKKYIPNVDCGLVGWRYHPNSVTAKQYQKHYTEHTEFCEYVSRIFQDCGMTDEEIQNWNAAAKKYRESRYEYDKSRV